MSRLRIIFMGTAELACASLEALADQPDFEVVAVVTQPDRPKGRSLHLQPSPVKETAVRRGIPVLQPERARNPEFIAELRLLRPDLIAVAAYGQILPPAILELPPHGCLNVHTSLLPKYRGAAPIQWALLNGETQTGVTIMKMDAGLDTGGILVAEATAIGPDDDSQSLHDRLAQMGARLLVAAVPAYVAGTLLPVPQPAEGASLARKITKADGCIDWSEPAAALQNRIRAFTPWPGAHTQLPERFCGARLKIWRAAAAEAAGPIGEVLPAGPGELVVGCGQGGLRVLELQREGGRRLSAAEFLAGHPLQRGDKLG